MTYQPEDFSNLRKKKYLFKNQFDNNVGRNKRNFVSKKSLCQNRHSLSLFRQEMFGLGKKWFQYRSRFHHAVHGSGASTIEMCTSELFSKKCLFQNSSILNSVSNRLCCRITWPPLQVAYEMNNKDNETKIYPCNK